MVVPVVEVTGVDVENGGDVVVDVVNCDGLGVQLQLCHVASWRSMAKARSGDGEEEAPPGAPGAAVAAAACSLAACARAPLAQAAAASRAFAAAAASSSVWAVRALQELEGYHS